jgi:hypothetical protein
VASAAVLDQKKLNLPFLLTIDQSAAGLLMFHFFFSNRNKAYSGIIITRINTYIKRKIRPRQEKAARWRLRFFAPSLKFSRTPGLHAASRLI